MKLYKLEIQACFNVLRRHFLYALDFFQNSFTFRSLNKQTSKVLSELEGCGVPAGLPTGNLLSRQSISGRVG